MTETPVTPCTFDSGWSVQGGRHWHPPRLYKKKHSRNKEIRSRSIAVFWWRLSADRFFFPPIWYEVYTHLARLPLRRKLLLQAAQSEPLNVGLFLTNWQLFSELRTHRYEIFVPVPCYRPSPSVVYWSTTKTTTITRSRLSLDLIWPCDSDIEGYDFFFGAS